MRPNIFCVYYLVRYSRDFLAEKPSAKDATKNETKNDADREREEALG
jgi:hypothetical protein